MTPERKRRPVAREHKTPTKATGRQRSTRTRSSSGNTSGDLVIDAEDDEDTAPVEKHAMENGQPKRVLRRKRRKMTEPCDEEELFDEKFEETIRKSAVKNNLTPICVKKLLKKLVMNDHVFAIVRLKEEGEDEKKKENVKEKFQEPDDGDDEDEEEKEEEHPLPKLTRLKAKQLNQTLFPLVPLNAPATDKEVEALIREDLNSDDDDEEYRPGADDIHSDDDPNTTISDIDSQPRTPLTAATVTGNESELQYTPDGLFKIPKPRNDSYCSQSEQEQENIALRTRSKLCLSTTDIETLESTFIPPDITTDMYEYDCDMDQAWKDFLEEFTKPLPKDLEEDDDNDPEYVAADMAPLDAEEMRAVKVSKKELNELVSELMEMSNIDEPYLEQALNETINESLNCTQIDARSVMLGTPLLESELQCSTVAMQQPTMQTSFPEIAETFPTQMVPPGEATATSQTMNCDTSPLREDIPSAVPNFTSTPIIAKHSMCRNDSTVGGYEHFVQSIPQKLEASEENIDTQPSTSKMPNRDRFFIKYSVPDETMVSLSEPSVILKPATVEEKRYRFRTTEVPVKVELPDAAEGFTDFQLQLLQQQLRMHVQLTTQHFLQTYAHPLFWTAANTFKGMLRELETLGKSKPTIVPWNLPLAVDCCQSWEDGLSVDNESNARYIKFLDDEITHAEKIRRSHKFYQGELHWRIKEKIINSRAFLYPSLVPHKTFRLCPMERIKLDRFTKSEEHMIAFWFEQACDQFKAQHTARNTDKVMKKPSVSEMCDYVVQHQWPDYNRGQLLKLVYHRKKSIHPNAIEFFITHGYAPPFKHVLEIIDFSNVIPLALYQKGILPSNWDRYILSSERIAKNKQQKTTSLTELKVVHQQPRPSASPLLEASDATVLPWKIRVLAPEKYPAAVESDRDATIPTPIDRTQCESAIISVVAYANGDVVTNLGEISECVVQVNEANSTEDMSSDVSIKRFSLPAAKHATAAPCVCACHCSEHNAKRVVADNLPDGELHLGSLTDSSDKRTGNADLACTESDRCDATPTPGKNVAKRSFDRSAANATLYTILKKYLKEVGREWKRDRGCTYVRKPSHLIEKVYAHLKQLEVYTRFLDGLRKMSENLVTYRHLYRALRKYHPERPPGASEWFHFQDVDGSLVVSARYITHRFDDYCSMDDKDAVFAFNYYEKVEETLQASGRSDLLERFEEILKKFNELEDSVALLYYHVEDLLGESFPELVDMFLTFLLPGQAAEVGKFLEHFILTNMSDFLEKLNIFFAKQPSQIRKVHACLNELSNEPNVTMDQVKLKVLPLLKGSVLLSEWFLQLFPSERPPESPLCDFENVTMKKSSLTENCDPGMVYEQVPYIEAVPENVENAAPPNAIRYIQGRIYQGALPARLTFLANNCLAKCEPTEGESSSLEHNLCDEATLKAHAIRLNPLVHCPKGITYADVAPLLAEGTAEGHGLGAGHEVTGESVHTEDEPKGVTSPKKVPPKLPIKKRFNSPTSRKLSNSPSDENSSSPTGKELAVSKKTSSVPAAVCSDSKALSTSKKLKTLIEAPQSSSHEENRQEIPLTVPPLVSLPQLAEVASLPESTNGPVTLKEKCEEQEPVPAEQPSTAPEAPSWTREEDEIILLKLVKGYSSVDAFVQQIEPQLPERTCVQIRSRVEFLNEMLRRVNKR